MSARVQQFAGATCLRFATVLPGDRIEMLHLIEPARTKQAVIMADERISAKSPTLAAPESGNGPTQTCRSC